MTARVLIVDDSASRRDSLAARLSDEFFEVATSDSGPAALTAARRDGPDIVLLASPLARLDPYETCRRLKSDPATAHVPVVLITRAGEPAARLRGFAVGIDDFLVEPVEPAELAARVRSLARLKTLLDEIRAREPGGETPVLGDLASPDTRATIAIVDDGAPRVADLFAMLRGFGTVLTLPTGLPTDRLRGLRCDLVVVGLGEGALDGLRVVSRLRSWPETRHLPVLAFVPRAERAVMVRAFEIGASDCVTMPVDMIEVVARVRTLLRRGRLTERLRRNLVHSMRLAATDAVTGVYNRHHLVHQLNALSLRARTTAKPLAAMMVDLDHFKSVNDRFGHAAGDRALRAVGHELSATVRGLDVVARYGGEEFAVLMPDSDLDAARRVADRVRAAVETLHERHPGVPALTVSIGVAVTGPAGEDGGEVLARADAALYAAKLAGRNRVISDGAQPQAA
jgi:two-component system cell cycle response regulator